MYIHFSMYIFQSKFYHIGTMEEYRHHFCVDPLFCFEMNMNKYSFVGIVDKNKISDHEPSGTRGLSSGMMWV